MFWEFDDLCFAGYVPKSYRFVIRKAHNMDIVSCEFAAVHRAVKKKIRMWKINTIMVKILVPLVAFENTEETFWSHIKELHMAFITACYEQLAIWTERGPIWGILKSSELAIDLVCNGVVNFDFVSTCNCYEIRFNGHNIHVIDRPKFFDSNWKLVK